MGIWYKKVPKRTYVWVFNRDNPLTNSSSGVLKIESGNLILFDQVENGTMWSSNITNSVNLFAQLLDTGNFVLRQENDGSSENYLWQSFNYPTDTLLPGMKLGWDSKTGLNRFLTSWKSRDNPSTGDFSFKMETRGFPEIFLKNKQHVRYRSGPWNGLRFSGVPEMKTGSLLIFSFVMDANEIEYSFELRNQSLYSRLLVNPSGDLERYTWIDENNVWNRFWYAPKDQCDRYMECGVYGVCDTNASPVCKCMKGFEPKNPQAWSLRDGSDGCVRQANLNCHDDGFLALKNMKLPETSTSFVDVNMNLAQCEKICRENCTCTGYASTDIEGGNSGCVIWTGVLLDMRQYAVSEGGQDFYVRVAASDLENGGSGGSQKGSSKTKTVIIATSIALGMVILLSGLTICFVRKRKALKKAQISKILRKGPNEKSQDFLLNEAVIPSKREYSGESTMDELELPLFDYDAIALATNNFSDANKLGQGGFGSVYKGLLVEGQDIAVKRLSKSSGQGIEEFKNELRLIARLQHRNLVRLLGCCIEMEEKMLIYEYLANKSLDSILFNKQKSLLLNWQRRFNIICGIARGLLYLHQDSRFRIIHRDLKASNVLLDQEMNPKISDFGMARIFGGDQTEADTRRIVGTYGYMAPEYAMDGHFSIKSDVFSFGVLVMEIICGMKNRGFYYTNSKLNLLGHVYRLWREGKGLELMDPAVLGDTYSPSEVLRCIQVGLLCVQEHAEDRPTMSNVVLMLSSETAKLPQPKNPGFCLGRRPLGSESSSSKQDDESCTVNQVTVTMLQDGR